MNKSLTRRRGTRLVAVAVAGIAAMSIGVGAISMAVFTDTETVDASFTSGTIILDATKIDGLGLSLTLGENWMPGDSITGSVDVENDGTNPLRYSLNTTTTSVAGAGGGVLNQALTIEVRPVDATTPVTKCNEFDGVPVLQTSEVLGASNVMFGNPSPTDGTGDVTIAPLGTHVLCVRVSLPLTTGDTYQGATAVTTFTFNAEQTENN
jgi:predicted ribosomally synthesized peptide with SipW-like signal peptide